MAAAPVEARISSDLQHSMDFKRKMSLGVQPVVLSDQVQEAITYGGFRTYANSYFNDFI